MEFKEHEDLHTVRNGRIMNVTEDEASIGMHVQKENMEFHDGGKMKRGAEPKIFDNNGGESKADGAGTINKNGEYGPVTYGF